MALTRGSERDLQRGPARNGMAGQKMKITRIADQVRNIPLREVLERYGFRGQG